MASKANKEIQALLKQADRIAMDEVIRIVRSVLSTYKKPHCFRMAMGTYSFYYKDGGVINLQGRAYYKALNNFMDEWDDLLKITGCPLKIDKDGSIDENY